MSGPVAGLIDRARRAYAGLPTWVRGAIVLAVLAVIAALPFILPSISTRSNYYVSLLFKVGLAALLALGLNVVVGFAGLLDLGYVAFFAISAYAYAIMTGAVRFTLDQRVDGAGVTPPEFAMWMWLIFFAAMAVALLAGVLLGAPTLRLRGDYLALVTLGFGEIVRILANNLRGQTAGPLGVKSIPHPRIFGFDFGLDNAPYYWLTLLLVCLAIFVVTRTNAGRVGRAWAAVREDEVAAAAMGVPTVRMKLLAFATGAAIASTAGVVYASQITYVSPKTFALLDPTFGSVILLAMVVLGGMGGIAGPIVGAAAMVFLPEYFRFIGDARFLVFGGALVLIMIFRPQGLVPNRRRSAELRGHEPREEQLFDVQHEETPA